MPDIFLLSTYHQENYIRWTDMDEASSCNIFLLSSNTSNIVMDKLYLRHLPAVCLVRARLTVVLVKFSHRAPFGSSQEFPHAL